MDEKLEKVTKLYRSQTDKMNRANNSIKDMKRELRGNNILHSRYVELERKIEMAISERNEFELIAMGIYMAREELF